MTLPDRLRSHAQNNEMGPSGGYTEAGHLLNEAAAAIEMQRRVVADAQADVEKLDAEGVGTGEHWTVGGGCWNEALGSSRLWVSSSERR